MELLLSAWKPPSPIRLISVTALHITEAEDTFAQEDLFQQASDAARSEKRERIEQAMDAIRGRFGSDAISFGVSGPGGRDRHSD